MTDIYYTITEKTTEVRQKHKNTFDFKYFQEY